MGRGIDIEVVGDSSLFSALGKGVAYLVRANGSQYMIDCGATPFHVLGKAGIFDLKGMFATHSHEDHRRWFTDLVLFMHYQPPNVAKRLRLFTSEAIHEEYEKNSKGALERSLSADSRRVVDVPYDRFVDKVVLGPRAKYHIVPRAVDKGEGRTWRVVETATGKPVPPDRAKVVINPIANRPRMIFKDPELDEWVEPESYYPFTSTTFYEADRNDFVDEESGASFRAVKAAAWHGPPTIGILVTLGEDMIAFSSDTVYDPTLWLELVETRHELPKEAAKRSFKKLHVIEDDINNYIQRVWSRERYEEAMRCYDGAVVIHDADFERSVVHTPQSNFSPDSDWRRLILTHTPDGFASIYPITVAGKTYRVIDGDVLEVAEGTAWPLDADLYFKDNDARLWVGYKSEKGAGRLWETKRGLAVVRNDESPGDDCTFLGNYELYVDIDGMYVPAPASDGDRHRLRADRKIELVSESDSGSTGTVVENVRGNIPGK